MESNETPKETAPNIPNAENKELRQKATELAETTRRRGAGGIYGRFPTRLVPILDLYRAIEFTTTGGFIQGEANGNFLWFSVEGTPYELRQKNDNRQIWTKSKYVPPTEEVTQELKMLFGLVTVRKKTNRPYTYHGKQGGFNWVRFDYYMAVHDPDGRGGSYVNMMIAVPPDLARQIDEQVERNIYFPDAFFKALYPGYIGPDKQQYITRIPSKELQVVDLTGKNQKSKMLQYPQPIPY